MVAYRHADVDGVPVVHRSDPRESVSEWLGLTEIDGRTAGVVEHGSAKHQLAALVDLVDLELTRRGPGGGVSLLLDRPHPEAVAALEVLRDSASPEVAVDLRRHDGHRWIALQPSEHDHADAERHYPGWAGLLGADFTVPTHVERLVADVGLPQLRAYPQLTARGQWSLRLEGLQVGRAWRGGHGWLDVGAPRATDSSSAERRAWLQVWPAGRFAFDVSNVPEAAAVVRTFARRWHALAGGKQNEHVLESRILRGAVDVDVGTGALRPIRDDNGVVSWGSQFPTKWGPGRSVRYLDALLRDPVDDQVPWAVEMKVRLSEGQYYRHAVAQAVLYRHFIRSAEALHAWFDAHDLVAGVCRAAVVVPEFRSDRWRSRLTRLCESFDVTLVEVPETATLR